MNNGEGGGLYLSLQPQFVFYSSIIMGIGSLQSTQTLRFFAPTFNTQDDWETNPLGGNYQPPKLVLETDGQDNVEVLGCVELLDAQQGAQGGGMSATHCVDTDELGYPLFLSLKRDEHYNIEFSNSNDQNNKFELGDSLILTSFGNPTHLHPFTVPEEKQRWSEGDFVSSLSWWDEGSEGVDGMVLVLPRLVHTTTITTFTTGFPSKLKFTSESKGGERWMGSLMCLVRAAIPPPPLMSIDFRIEFS